LDTVSTRRTALSNRSNSVLPGISGAGNGFMSLIVLFLLDTQTDH
jgi:hypothetical protein